MPQNVGSIEDPISKNIRSRHLEFCKAGRATWKLTLYDINTTSKEPKTLRGCRRRQLFRHSARRQWGRSNLSTVKNILSTSFFFSANYFKYHDQCLGNNRAIKWRKSSGRLRDFFKYRSRLGSSLSYWYPLHIISALTRSIRSYVDNIDGTLEQSRMKLFSSAPIRCSYHLGQCLFFFKKHHTIVSRSAVNRTESGRMPVNLHLLKNSRDIKTF